MSPSSGRLSLATILTRSYEGRRVFVTGHTGFVGSWLSYWLARSGAQVSGFALASEPGGIFDALGLADTMTSVVGDIRDAGAVAAAFRDAEPEIVFHLAAQALVIPAFDDPVGTLAANVMGTAHLLEALRHQPGVRACIVVTSDKCYAHSSGAHGEDDPLGGEDPYSASKAAAEIVAHAYRSSYFARSATGVATARAGNIVGGGDLAEHRIVPDCVRAMRAGEPVRIRNPEAVRPWQHVLDAVAGYLRLGDALMAEPVAHAQAWNFGPPAEVAATVGEIAELFVACWRARGRDLIEDPFVERQDLEAPSARGRADVTEGRVPERSFLALDSTRAQLHLGWSQLLGLEPTIDWTVEWYHDVPPGRVWAAAEVTASQVTRYLELDASAGLDDRPGATLAEDRRVGATEGKASDE